MKVIRAVIIIVGGVLMYITGSKGEWGPFAVAAVIVAVLLFMGSVERTDTRAWLNWRDYWANGRRSEPRVRNQSDRYTDRERAEYYAYMEGLRADALRRIDRAVAKRERRERRRAVREARKVRNVQAVPDAPEVLDMPVVEMKVRPEDIRPAYVSGYDTSVVCPVCGSHDTGTRGTKWVNGRRYAEFYCTRCGKVRQVIVKDAAC